MFIYKQTVGGGQEFGGGQGAVFGEPHTYGALSAHGIYIMARTIMYKICENFN